MHTEFRITGREGWKYDYTGAELLEAAKRVLEGFQSKEMLDRDQMARMMRDSAVPANSPDVDKLRKEIQFSAEQVEMCRVFVHEFARKPDRTFNLSLGDVVYFGLERQPSAEE